MVDITSSTRRWTRRFFGPRTKAADLHPGEPMTADGMTALTLIEIAVGEAVVFGPVHPATAARRRFLEIASQAPQNLWGRPVERIDAAGAREALARAMGLALAGTRTAVFLSQGELLEVADLLGQAAARRLPMVIHAASASGTAALPGANTGEDGIHAAMASGALVWTAASVQEAADAAAAAHRAAEDALLPVVLAVDGGTVALSVQDFLLADAEFLKTFVGDPNAPVHPPVPSQEMLLGRHRRRVPRWHDSERPMLGGSLGGSREAALAAAGRFAYLDVHAALLFDAAFQSHARETGRRHPAVTAHHVDDAKVVIVALAGLNEMLEAAADRIRHTRKIKVGVIGLHGLSPFPGEQIAELLQGKETVVVLEGTTPAAGLEAPLHQHLRAALDPQSRPRMTSALAGAGLGALRAADVDALIVSLAQEFRPTVLLGLTFSGERSEHPKREVLLGGLRRHYPEAGALGIAAPPGAAVDPPDDVFSVAFHRAAGHGGEDLAGEAAELITMLRGGHVRTRSELLWDRWGTVLTDRLLHSPHPVRDPGPDARVDMALWLGDGIPAPETIADRVREGGVLVLPHEPGAKSLKETLPAGILRSIAAKRLKLYVVKPSEESVPAARDERLLGALAAVLSKEGTLEASPRKLAARRGALLEGLSEVELEERLARFRAGFDAVLGVETAGFTAPEPAALPEPEVPAPVRRLRRTDEAVDSLSRFWDQVGVLYRRGETGELTPDPYLGTGVLPPLSASFRDFSGSIIVLPELDPALCTGCGACWSLCPDAALAPLALAPSALVEGGMALAKESGRSAEGLRMVAGKLASSVGEAITLSPTPGASAAAVLDDAFARVLKKTAVSEERKIALQDAFTAVKDAVGKLPVSRTDPFFDGPETDAKGSGALFTMAVSPDACKACGLCVTACEPRALTLVPRDRTRTLRARELWKLVESLPETPAEMLERAAAHPVVGRVGAALLAREARHAFTGGDGAEPGSGEKIALRQVLAVTQRTQVAVRRNLLETLAALRDRLSAEIREGMAKALPMGDLDALAHGLEAMDRPEVDLGQLSQRVETAFDSGRVDVIRLKRLVDQARAVTDLHWRIEQGEGGLGQAPFSLVLGPGTPSTWAAVFPQNPFAVPVTVAPSGEVADLARGLREGELRRVARDAGLLRRARLELDDPKEAERSGDKEEHLGIHALTADEHHLAPPFFVVLSESAAGRDWGGLSALLDGSLPIKILVLAESPLGLTGGIQAAHPADRGGEALLDLGLFAAAAGRAFTAQTSFAAPEHLARSVERALAWDGPALLVIHAPSPARHGFPADHTHVRAKEAVDARVFPLFRIDPRDPALTHELEGNPAPEEIWFRRENGDAVTPAHWALGEARYAREFGPVDEEKGEPIPLAEYLELPSEARAGKIPVVMDAQGARFAVGEDLANAAGERRKTWLLLRARGAPPAPVERPASPDAIEEALASVRASYESRIADLRLDLARQVRGRLLTLLARRTGGNGEGEETR